MIIAVCDPKGIAIEAIKTILYHDKGLSDRISRIYEFWNMEQLLDASRDSSFDCIVFPNYCNSHKCAVYPADIIGSRLLNIIRGTLSLYGIFSIGKRHVPFGRST